MFFREEDSHHCPIFRHTNFLPNGLCYLHTCTDFDNSQSISRPNLTHTVSSVMAGFQCIYRFNNLGIEKTGKSPNRGMRLRAGIARIYIRGEALTTHNLQLKYFTSIASATAVLSTSFITVSPTEAKTWPYSCTWISSIDPNAQIVFTHITGTNTRNGILQYKDKEISKILVNTSQGYSSTYWNNGTKDHRGNQVIHFSGGQPLRSLSTSQRERKKTSYLIVGLGSYLHYSDFRSNQQLIRAAEGLWREAGKCR